MFVMLPSNCIILRYVRYHHRSAYAACGWQALANHAGAVVHTSQAVEYPQFWVAH
jgi:hypothetical protein